MDKNVIRSFGGICMSKDNVLKYPYNEVDNLDVNQQIIEQMREAKSEMDAARNLFNSVNDSKLIEIAIYSEDIAKKKFDYLLSIAKQRGLRVANDYIFGQSANEFF